MDKIYHKLSVLIPAYNEEARIENTLLETRKCMRQMGISFEIIVVDDGSTDQTFAKAKQQADETVHVYRNAKNGGKGRALKTAFCHSEGDVVLFLDADLDIHPNQCIPLMENLKRTDFQVTIGSKLHKNAEITYPLIRRVLSRGYSSLVKLLFHLPFRDTQTGIKLFESQVLKRVFHMVQLNGYAFDLELLALANRSGFSIEEVPIRVNFGNKPNHMTPKVILKMFRDTVALFFRLRRLAHSHYLEGNQ